MKSANRTNFYNNSPRWVKMKSLSELLVEFRDSCWNDQSPEDREFVKAIRSHHNEIADRWLDKVMAAMLKK